MKTTLFTIILLIILSFTGCFLNSTSGNMVTPVIRAVGMPETDIIDSITLKITGPDMDDIEVRYSELPDLINIAVPEGSSRRFELTVSLVNSYTGPVVSYRGIDTIDITSEGSVVTLNMGIGSTKIVIPDYYNSRVIQFDDITAMNEVIFTGIQLGVITGDSGWASNFYPYDIDFDSDGRIYIANNNASSGYGRVVRISNINGESSLLYEDRAASITSIAVDRNNHILYYSTSGSLYSTSIDGTNDIVRMLPLIGAATISSIQSITVDGEGKLYMVADVGQVSADYRIIKLDPLIDSSSELVLIETSSTIPENSSASPKDLVIKGSRLYLANFHSDSGSEGDQVVEFSISDLSLKGSFGTYVGNNDSSDFLLGHFYGPRRFVTPLNVEMTIIDDSPDWWQNKIIQIEDITGSGWKTYPNSGSSDESGQNFFKFFDNTYSGA